MGIGITSTGSYSGRKGKNTLVPFSVKILFLLIPLTIQGTTTVESNKSTSGHFLIENTRSRTIFHNFITVPLRYFTSHKELTSSPAPIVNKIEVTAKRVTIPEISGMLIRNIDSDILWIT